MHPTRRNENTMNIPKPGSIHEAITIKMLYADSLGDLTGAEMRRAIELACRAIKEMGIEPYLPYVTPHESQLIANTELHQQLKDSATTPGQAQPSEARRPRTEEPQSPTRLSEVTDAVVRSVMDLDEYVDELTADSIDYRELLKNLEPPSPWDDEAIEDSESIGAMTQEEAKRIYNIILKTRAKE